MSKLASKFGSAFKRQATKKIKFGECELIVNMPTKAQMDQLNDAIYSPDESLIEAEYQVLRKAILSKIDDPAEYGEAINITDNDVKVNDVSLRAMAKAKVVQNNRVEAYLNMIGFEEDGQQYRLTIKDLEEELSSSDIKELLNAVEAAINPNFAALRKN